MMGLPKFPSGRLRVGQQQKRINASQALVLNQGTATRTIEFY